MISLLLGLFLTLANVFASPVSAVECVESSSTMSVEDLQAIQKACQQKIDSNHQEQTSLKQIISTINSKINLAQGQINQTISQINSIEKEIEVLGGVLDKVNESTDILTKIYLARVKETYRRLRVNPTELLLSSSDFGDYFTKLKYINTIKSKDQLILSELEKSRKDYDSRRQSKLEKQQEIEKLKIKMEEQKKVLSVQQKEKQNLLAITASDEKKFQDLLAKAQAELRAIESIIAGSGTETLVGEVSSGDKIASVIPGASACSTGGHLHFEVVQNKSHQSPASFLKTQEVIWDNSPDGQFSFNGSWDWPVQTPARITQGYGHTAYSSRYAGDKHTGIDMINKGNLDVKAVRKGKLYRGSIPCGGGTLKYVHVKHSDDDKDTFYLHVNYF